MDTSLESDEENAVLEARTRIFDNFSREIMDGPMNEKNEQFGTMSHDENEKSGHLLWTTPYDRTSFFLNYH